MNSAKIESGPRGNMRKPPQTTKRKPKAMRAGKHCSEAGKKGKNRAKTRRRNYTL